MKVSFICLVFVAALGSSALADIQQTQNTQLGLGSQILLLTGDQTADTIQNLAVYNEQGAAPTASQSLTGTLVEIGHGSSGGAQIGVDQNLVAGGLQTQDLSGFAGLTLASQTLLFHTQEGPSVGDLMHNILVGGNAASFNPITSLNVSALIQGLQNAN
jgi:hypothetical protein